MNKQATGAICILAYPAEFVSMIPGWYRKPMEWVGMVNDGQICVGHSAMALINKETGVIHYADFGRYVSPIGYGRTRMAKTDPDVVFDYTVDFDDNGNIKDKIGLFKHFYKLPEKTHGGDIMFASLNQNVDFEACFQFINSMNDKGSIIYDPFKEGTSNCSVFVYDSLLKGAKNESVRKKLKRKSPITPSPLANVFHGTQEESYEFSPDGHTKVSDKSLSRIVSFFFRKPPKRKVQTDLHIIEDHMSFLDGLGDQAFLFLDKIMDDRLISVTKLDRKGKETFTFPFIYGSDFNPRKDFVFIHDCNAHWMTVEQGGLKIRLERSY